MTTTIHFPRRSILFYSIQTDELCATGKIFIVHHLYTRLPFQKIPLRYRGAQNTTPTRMRGDHNRSTRTASGGRRHRRNTPVFASTIPVLAAGISHHHSTFDGALVSVSCFQQKRVRKLQKPILNTTPPPGPIL